VFLKHISYDTGKTINRGGKKTQTGWEKKELAKNRENVSSGQSCICTVPCTGIISRMN